jgi:exodeoxyribonuclease V alpha subunit
MAAREQQSQCLTGQVERVVYQSSENQYTVLVFNTQTGQVTATGYFPPLQASENLRLWGSWVHHPKYGRQFSVERFERILPNTPQGVIGYLASGLFRGIGPKTAKRIVDALGPNALSAIQQNPAVLLAIPGISAHRAAIYRNKSL